MIINVTPDKEKARSMLNLAAKREEFASSINSSQFPTMAAENYYEIVKELSSAILLAEGIKTTGENAHKETISEMSRHGMADSEISIMDDLRMKRNKSSYEGKEIDISYLKNRKGELLAIISKLKSILTKRLN